MITNAPAHIKVFAECRKESSSDKVILTVGLIRNS